MPLRALTLALLVVSGCFTPLLVVSGCFTPRIERDPNESAAMDTVDGFFDQFEGALKPGPPPDCDNVMFARTFKRCPSPEATFPFIWDAMTPTLTPDGAASFIGSKMSRLDRCCEDSEAVVEIDVVIDCAGNVIDADVDARGSILPRWRQLCVRDEVRAWKFDRPEPHERGLHFLITCGRRRP